ncbi:uncharacterized protein LOC123469850 [Daphnia magna]|uniref:uncharacterized protein LOC123469850 n=1 Tax=Daphnia magna TaxID=35525 RepID=UPI001E1BD543|nr:uncharacterized protein LOC123469850 [Daphnia magna]
MLPTITVKSKYVKKKTTKVFVGPRQMRNRVNARLQEYYAEVEKEDMSNLVDMPCKEKIRNVDDIPETCNEHLGCSQRQVTHQSSPNESVGEGEPARDYDSEQHNEVNQLDSEPDSDYCVIIQDKTLQYFLIENFVGVAGAPYVIGKRYLKVESMFEYPLSSTILFEAVVSCLSELELYPFDVIRMKAALGHIGFGNQCE